MTIKINTQSLSPTHIATADKHLPIIPLSGLIKKSYMVRNT